MTIVVPDQNTLRRDKELAVRILGEFGYETVCFQTLQRGMKSWLSKRRAGMVGYVEAGGYWITAGGPIGHRDDIVNIAEEFERCAHQARQRVCYVCAERHNAKPLTSHGTLLWGS